MITAMNPVCSHVWFTHREKFSEFRTFLYHENQTNSLARLIKVNNSWLSDAHYESCNILNGNSATNLAFVEVLAKLSKNIGTRFVPQEFNA